MSDLEKNNKSSFGFGVCSLVLQRAAKLSGSAGILQRSAQTFFPWPKILLFCEGLPAEGVTEFCGGGA